jgi:hypothetical protein
MGSAAAVSLALPRCDFARGSAMEGGILSCKAEAASRRLNATPICRTYPSLSLPLATSTIYSRGTLTFGKADGSVGVGRSKRGLNPGHWCQKLRHVSRTGPLSRESGPNLGQPASQIGPIPGLLRLAQDYIITSSGSKAKMDFSEGIVGAVDISICKIC